MLRMFIYLSTVLIVLSESACLVARHADGEPGKCELHGCRLHKSLVRMKYGAYCAPGTHLGSGSEEFPNAKHPICGGCSVREPFRFIYNCRKCNRAKRSYNFSHKNDHPERKIRSAF